MARSNVVGLAGPTVGASLGTFVFTPGATSRPIDNDAAGNVPDELAVRAGRCMGDVGLCGATADVAGVPIVSPHQEGLAGKVAHSGIEQRGTSTRLDHFTNRNGVRTVNRGREKCIRAS